MDTKNHYTRSQNCRSVKLTPALHLLRSLRIYGDIPSRPIHLHSVALKRADIRAERAEFSGYKERDLY